MDYKKVLNEAEELYERELYKLCVIKCGTIFEVAFKEVFQTYFSAISSIRERKEITEIEAEIGKHQKTFQAFGFGELVGLARKAQLFKRLKKQLLIDLENIKVINFSGLVDIRNKVHKDVEVSAIQANLFVSNLKAFLLDTQLLKPAVSIYCQSCKKEIPYDAKICPYCKIELSDANTTTTEDDGIETIKLGKDRKFTPLNLAWPIVIGLGGIIILVMIAGVLLLFKGSTLGISIAVGIIVALASFVIWFLHPKEVAPPLMRGKYLEEIGQEITFEISGKCNWTDTSISIYKDSEYYFRTTGKIVHSYISGEHDADGNPRPNSPRSKLTPQFRVAALIGKINNDGAPFLIGVRLNKKFDKEGRLLVAINDWPLFDNVGFLKMHVRRMPRILREA